MGDRYFKAGVDPSHALIIEEEDRHVPSKGWAEMIRKVYGIDPLLGFQVFGIRCYL